MNNTKVFALAESLFYTLTALEICKCGSQAHFNSSTWQGSSTAWVRLKLPDISSSACRFFADGFAFPAWSLSSQPSQWQGACTTGGVRFTAAAVVTAVGAAGWLTLAVECSASGGFSCLISQIKDTAIQVHLYVRATLYIMLFCITRICTLRA